MLVSACGNEQLVIVLIIAILISGCAGLTPAQTQVAVKELVTQVQVAVNKIQESSKASSVLPPLKSAELTLSSKAEKDTNGKVALFLSAGGGRTQSDANSITMVLIPNPTGNKFLNKGKGEEIANAVIAAVSALENLKGLKLKSLTVIASLEIVKTLKGGLEVELSGVSIEGESKKVLTNGNSLKLTFEAPEPAAKS